MQRFLDYLKKIFSPHILVLLLLNIISVVLLSYVFVKMREQSIVAYVSYAISAYTLTADIVNFIPTFNKIKEFKNNNKYVNQYFTDKCIQFDSSIYFSILLNVGYAVVNFIAGLFENSVWLFSVAVYYFTLTLLRLFILIKYHRMNKIKSNKRVFELRVYRTTGIVMFFVSAVMSGMTVQMIRENVATTHSDTVTIAMAAFTFSFFAIAIANLQKYRKTHEPIISASKMLNFACALMSIFTLQTSMMSAFNEDEQFRVNMNIATGSAVFVLVIGLAIYMIMRANKMIKEVNNER